MTEQTALRHRMLVVDDEEPILFALKEYFTALGYQVDCAREREEAEALLAYVRYSVVIADLWLAGVNGTEGLELAGYVRERSPSARFILLTAYGSPEVEVEARRRGVDAILNKPRPLAEIARVVLGLLEGQP